jgi:enoyl-CoA hydratase/carnithine racemase
LVPTERPVDSRDTLASRLAEVEASDPFVADVDVQIATQLSRERSMKKANPDAISYRRAGKVAYITFKRPEVLNALDAQARELFADLLSRFDMDEKADVAIVSGEGRSFCAGADLRELRQPKVLRDRRPRPVEGYLGRCKNWKPVISAVHGYCLGVGFVIALESDLVVASEDAKFGMSESKRGLVSHVMLAHLKEFMPSKVMTEMLLTGREFSASALESLGAVNRVVPTGTHLDAAKELADELASLPAIAVRGNVQMTRWMWIRSTVEMSLFAPGVEASRESLKFENRRSAK